MSSINDIANATGEKRHHIILRIIARQAIEDGECWPCSFNWDSHYCNERWHLSGLEIDENIIVPTFRNWPFSTSGTWDTIASSGVGLHVGCRELAAYSAKHQLPICIRMGNIDNEGTAFMFDNNYENSPFHWNGNYSGNHFLGLINITSGTPWTIPAATGLTYGDFYRVNISGGGTSGIFGDISGYYVKSNDRLAVLVTNPSGSNGAEWSRHTTLSDNLHRPTPFASEQVWRNIAISGYATSFMQRLYEAYPNPPLVLWLSNNEPWLEGLGTVQDWRFNASYSGLTNYQIRMQYRALYKEKRKALYEQVKANLPSGWQRVLRFQNYNSCGGEGQGGFRTFPYHGSDDQRPWDDYLDTEYGLDWYWWNGGSSESYGGDPQGNGGYLQYRSQIIRNNWLPRLVKDYTKRRNPEWVEGASIYAGSVLTTSFTKHGYHSPPAVFAGNAKLQIMYGNGLIADYQNHATPLDELRITISGVDYTVQDYYDKVNEEILAIYDNPEILRRLRWPLQVEPIRPGGDPHDTHPIHGTFSGLGIFTLVNNSHYNVETAIATDEIPITIVRRNNKGQGLIYAWHVKSGDFPVDVYTLDGTVSVVATIGGTFYTYDLG